MAEKIIERAARFSNGKLTLSSTLASAVGKNKRITNAILMPYVNATNPYGYKVAVQYGDDKAQVIDFISPKKAGNVSINITEELNCMLKNNTQEISLIFEPAISISGETKLFVEYVSEQIMHENNSYCEVDVKSAGKGKVNLATGQLRFANAGLVYNGWQANKQSIDVDDATNGIKSFETHCGKGWQLSVQQYLVKRKNGNNQEVYTYIDGEGNYHEFTEKYYYKNGDSKVYVSKNKVAVDLNGKLTYNGKEIKVEQRSTGGFALETDYSGFKGGKWIEQRQKEQIELEDNVSAYAKQLKEYVIINKSNGETVSNGILKNKFSANALSEEAYNAFMQLKTSDKLLLTESEAIQYNSLLLQKTDSSKNSTGKRLPSTEYLEGVDYSDTELANRKFDGQYDSYLINMQRLVKDLRKDLAKLTKKSNYAHSSNPAKYLYDVYYKFLKDAQYTAENDCQLDVQGEGRVAAGWKNGTNLRQDANGNYTNGRGCYLHHLKDGICDLEKEISLIAEDTEVYYRKDDKCVTERENKMVLEQRLKLFQEDFQNRVEKLQQNIAIFEQEINDFIEEEQRQLVNRQIDMIIEHSAANVIEVEKYFKTYHNKRHELDQLYLQMPTNYITSQNSGVMGFNKYGQFVATFDSYENQTAILYEDGKIVTIKDTDNNVTSFEYNDKGLLSKIIAPNEKFVSFVYENDYMVGVRGSDGEEAKYTYYNGLLESVADKYDCGAQFFYDNYNRVRKVTEFSKVYSVTDKKVDMSSEKEYKTLAKINYHASHLTTTVKNNLGVATTYNFDILGKPVTVYEGNYSDPEEKTRSASFEYAGENKSYSISDNLDEKNLIQSPSKPIELKGYAEMSGFMSHETAIDATETAEGFVPIMTVDTAVDDPQAQYGSEAFAKHKYQVNIDDLPKGVTDYVVSAWAKADSAYIKSARNLHYGNRKAEESLGVVEDYFKASRKFELRAELTYDDGSKNVYSASFDWLNTGWQYLALPVEIKEVNSSLPSTFPFTVANKSRKLIDFAIIIDYSFNTGKAYFDCLALRQGNWTYDRFDANGRKLSSEDSSNKTYTKFIYDDKDRLVKEIQFNNQGKKFENTYEYNKQGSLVRSTNYAGVVEETVFDEKGREIKKIKYNLDDPTNKMYTESKRDDKGVVTADVDESGKYDSVKYTYDHNGEVSVKTDGKGNKTAYGYKDGQLVSISGDNEGERSTNTLSYTASLLTKSSNGDTDYNYSYDGWGRTVKVEIAGEKYAETHYIADNLSNVVLANGDIHEVRTDKYGNTERKSVTYADGSCEHVTSEYDKETQRLSKITIDNSEQGEYNISYSYDSKGHVIEEVRGGENPLEKKFDYTTDGDMKESVYKVVKDASAEVDKDKYETLTYAYETDHTPDRRDANVELPYGISQQFAYDGLGRTRGITLGQVLAKDVYYQGFGDHTTNRVSSVWYGVNGIRKDNNKYTYDKAGNIATITENGLETAKYVYDGLNRLVRENNSIMGKTSVVYDAAGNILYKTVNGRRTKYRYSQNGWKDQLISLTEGEQTYNFEYDVLGNPTLYKDVPMQWKGRRLTSYNGVNYAYDANGIRTSKVRNGIQYKYIYDGNNLIAEQHIQGSNSEWIYYLYGVDGVAGFRYNGATYLYRKNVQGDVTHIYTESGEQVAHYAYDAWGNVQILQDRNEIATINPFRYRSYYFDEESKFYYLQTRYYDPALGRFISADSIEYLDPETIGGLNLYAYCDNNPIAFVDNDGTEKRKWWEILLVGLAVAVVAAAFVFAAIATGGAAGIVLMSVGLGIGFGAADGAYNAYQNGTDIIGGMLSGAVKGGATGLALGLGIVTGTAALGMVGTLAAVTASICVNFYAGAIAYDIEHQMNGWTTSASERRQSGLMQAASGLISFGAGCIIGASGIYNVPGKYNSAGLLKAISEKFLRPQWIANFLWGQLIKNIVTLPLKFLEWFKGK